MEQQNKHIANIQKLEDEIRKLAIPYVSEEPDPLYWANFRVRVMEQISQNEAKKGLLAQIQQFLAGHIWGSSIAISAAALLVAGVMIFSPFGGDSPLKQTVSSAPVAALQLPAAPAQVAKPDLADIREQPVADMTHETHRSHALKYGPGDQPTDLAAVAEPAEPAEQAVSLDELSKPQLEAIVQDLENNE
jgi:hypothetical protein